MSDFLTTVVRNCESVTGDIVRLGRDVRLLDKQFNKTPLDQISKHQITNVLKNLDAHIASIKDKLDIVYIQKH